MDERSGPRQSTRSNFPALPVVTNAWLADQADLIAELTLVKPGIPAPAHRGFDMTADERNAYTLHVRNLTQV